MLLPLIKIKEVADRFQAHWTDAEAILGQPVVLQGGFGLSDFQGLIADFEAGTTDYVSQENKREGSLTNVSRLGRELRPRVVQFNRAVRALLPGSQVAGVLEVAPDAGMARAKQAEVFERVARLWEIVNLNSPAYPGFTPPLADKVEIVRLGLDCSPCFDRTCRFGHYNCLRELKPRLVIEALDRLVGDPVEVQ